MAKTSRKEYAMKKIVKKILTSTLIISLTFMYSSSAFANTVSKEKVNKNTVTSGDIVDEYSMKIEQNTKNSKLMEVKVKDNDKDVKNLTIKLQYSTDKKITIDYSTQNKCNLVRSNESKLSLNQSIANEGIDEEELFFVTDSENGVVATIGDIAAIDANGKKVNIEKSIRGSRLTCEVVNESDIQYPITIFASTYSVKHKYEYINTQNTAHDRELLMDARDRIDARQNSSLNTLIGLTNTIFGLFNTYTGILSMIIDGAVTSNAKYLEDCEDMYTNMVFAYNRNEMSCAVVIYPYRGTYQGKNKGYVYRADTPYYEKNELRV